MSRTLIIAEHDGQALNPSTSKCASCAAALGHDFDIVVIGSNIGAIATEAAAIDGAGGVIAIDAPHLDHPVAANHAAEVVAMADNYSHILGPSTTYGRDLMPRIAALLGVNQVSDISAVENAYHFKRRGEGDQRACELLIFLRSGGVVSRAVSSTPGSP